MGPTGRHVYQKYIETHNNMESILPHLELLSPKPLYRKNRYAIFAAEHSERKLQKVATLAPP